MPKGNSKSKRKAGGGRRKHGDGGRPASLKGTDEESIGAADISVLSVASSRPDMNDFDEANENDGDPTANENVNANLFEEKILEAFDGTMEKSAKTRYTSLEIIKKAFITRYMFDFIVDRKITIGDILERCMKRHKGEEQGSAAILAAVVCISLGPGEETDAIFKVIETHLIVTMMDGSASSKTREKCTTALGLLCFIADVGADVIKHIMDQLYSIFSASFFKGNGVAPTHSPDITSLHSKALEAWTLLLTIEPSSVVLRIAEQNIKRLSQLFESTDVELRIAAGETIAVLHEISRECDDDFEVDEMYSLCEKLRQLATDSQKFRAKKERRIQRHSFRDVLKAVEEREAPDITIKFGKQRLIIDSWCKKREYDAFCEVLGSGMNLHLSQNDLLRDIFKLGPPLNEEIITAKSTKFERHMENLAASKARTKTRSKMRDKRADVL